MAVRDTFERVEKKFLLSQTQLVGLLRLSGDRLQPDVQAHYTVQNLYYDTWDDRLLRASLEKPPYKEKLRLRAYGETLHTASGAFVEIKKKYKGVVYKRRVGMPLAQATDYLSGRVPASESSQITREMDAFLRRYDVLPKAYVGYDRVAMAGTTDAGLRLTLDRHIRFRTEQLHLLSSPEGLPILPEDITLMEVKFPLAMPFWLARLLSELAIYPTSFSKVGMGYVQYVLPRRDKKGGLHIA